MHEVLVTLMLNFVALLLVGEALHGPLGEPGAGFPQSPLFENVAWLPKLLPRHRSAYRHCDRRHSRPSRAHVLLWRTTFGFRCGLPAPVGRRRTTPASRCRARVFGLMLVGGALAGLAGGIEVLGVHYRLIEGFSLGFGFNAVAIALLGAFKPLGVIPAALFFGFLEAGALVDAAPGRRALLAGAR